MQNQRPTADMIIEKLQLEILLPEGGYFKSTYRSEDKIITEYGLRAAGSTIYYLVTPQTFSKFHRLMSDEVYHFYLGDPLTLSLVDESGECTEVVLGNDIMEGQIPQFVVPAHTWQGSRIKSIDYGFSLVGTTVTPGFVIEDFAMASREELLELFPHLELQIFALT